MSTISAADIRDLDASAVKVSAVVVAAVTPAHLGRPTPCAEWTLGELLAHMTAQHYGFAAAAEGNGADPAVWQVRPLGEDPRGTYAAAATRVIQAFAAPAALEREFVLPQLATDRAFPAAEAIGFHFIDYVVHAWDVARSLGMPVSFTPDVLDRALSVAHEVPDGAWRLAPGAAFRPSVAAPAGSGALEHVVALLGRSPTWPE